MEFHHNHEDSKSSSDDEDQTADLNNDDMAGTGRSYECVFCKRGFTTAQALGGHMNIHRKKKVDMINTRPNSTTTTTTSTKPADHNIDRPSTTLRSYPHQSYYVPAAPPWLVGPHSHAVPPSDDHEEDDLFSLSLGIGPSSQSVDHHNKQIKVANGGSCTQLGDAHELDLELRLGHA